VTPTTQLLVLPFVPHPTQVTSFGPQFYPQSSLFSHYLPEDVVYSDPPPEYAPPDYGTLMAANNSNRFNIILSLAYDEKYILQQNIGF